MPKTSRTETTFPNQVRFNWGYHDAAHSLRQGWMTPGHFWGFAKELGQRMSRPEDILSVHFDAFYAKGWLMGLRDAEAGRYTGNSAEAWKLAAA